MVKCSECGFPTLRDTRSGLLIEVPDDYRMSGKMPRDDVYKGVHNWPICFVAALDLFTEVQGEVAKQAIEQDDWPDDHVKPLIQKNRECPPQGKELGFVIYQQGFTPKDHREMFDRERLLVWQTETASCSPPYWWRSSALRAPSLPSSADRPALREGGTPLIAVMATWSATQVSALPPCLDIEP